MIPGIRRPSPTTSVTTSVTLQGWALTCTNPTAGSILATAALGAALPAISAADQMKAVIAPMIVAAIGILLSIAGVYMVRTKESATQKNLLRALLLGTGGSSALILVALAVMASSGWITWGVFGAVVAGLAAGVIIGQSTEYFTSDEYSPTRGIARQTNQGPATTIIEGMAVGMLSSWVPVLTISAAIIAAYAFAGGFENFAAGVYGIGFAAVGMLSTLGITLATDAFGPIADNAGGNAEMSHLPQGGQGENRRARLPGKHHGRDRQGFRHRLGSTYGDGPCGGLHRRG